MKAVILQRVIPSYRVSVFRRITSCSDLDVVVFHGEDLDELKARNSRDLTGINCVTLKAVAIVLFGRVFTWHIGLLQALKKARPDVIVCEAESHFLGYLTAIFYKLAFSQHTRLVMWCFYGLPGLNSERSVFHGFVKSFARRFFSGFISYTTYGKNFLIGKGFDRGIITTAVNVCDTYRFLALDSELRVSQKEAKDRLGLARNFVISYFGTLDSVKRPELMLDICSELDADKFHCLIVGDGPLYNKLLTRLNVDCLGGATLVGRVEKDLALYYRASDVVVVPGRGGIVISEAMCFGVPVIAYQADGVEYDLVIQNETGVIASEGSVLDFVSQIQKLEANPELLKLMGENSKDLIIKKFNTNNMAEKVLHAVRLAGGSK